MASRLWPSGLRARLVAAFLVVAIAVLGGSFFALHQLTGSDIRSSIDDRLRADLAEFADSPAGASQTSGQLARRARAFIAAQGYHADSRIFAVEAGGRAITSERRRITEELGESADERAREQGEAPAAGRGLLAAPTGFADAKLPGDGELRVLTQPVLADGAQIGTFRVAESLDQVTFAQGSLRDTLIAVGVVSIIVLVAAALVIATRLATPLKRIASFTSEVGTEDLDRRLSLAEGPAEVRSLAESFNRMLDRLQRSFEREREFVADASHELRTPVTIARGELDLLRREASVDERRRVDAVRRELERMERLVDDMLTLAAEDEGAVRRQPTLVSDLLADLRRDLPLLGQRRYEVAELGGTVEADPDRLAQVFRNLLANSVAHTSADGLIEVGAAASGDRVRFTVSDDGDGISDEEAAHLFDRFYRTDAGRGRERGGSGLGLAIARAIVEAHGGTIRALGVPGQGTRIVFELPGYRP